MESLAFIWTGTRDSKTTLLFSSASDKQASIKLQRIEHKAQAKMPASSGSIRQQGQHLHLQQGTFNCTILKSGIGGSGEPRRKWEEMGERERERESVEKCCFCLQNDL